MAELILVRGCIPTTSTDSPLAGALEHPCHQLKGAPLSCGSSRPGLPAGWPDARSPPSGTPASAPRKPGTGSCTASMSGQLLEPRQGGSRAGTREVICYGARALPDRPGPRGWRRRPWPAARRGHPRTPFSDRPSPLSAGPVTTDARAVLPRLVTEIPSCGDGLRILLIGRAQRSPIHGGSVSPDRFHNSRLLAAPTS
jgi:hypothetical protein